MAKLSKDVWVMLSLLVVLVLIALFAGYRQDKKKTKDFDPRRSSYSTAAAGLRGLYQTLDILDYRVRRHIDDLTVQPEDGVLFVISPDKPVSDDEKRSLRGWVERGNTLIVVSSGDYYVTDPEKHLQVSKSVSAVPSFLTPDVSAFNVAGPARVDEEESVFDDSLACSSGYG